MPWRTTRNASRVRLLGLGASTSLDTKRNAPGRLYAAEFRAQRVSDDLAGGHPSVARQSLQVLPDRWTKANAEATRQLARSGLGVLSCHARRCSAQNPCLSTQSGCHGLVRAIVLMRQVEPETPASRRVDRGEQKTCEKRRPQNLARVVSVAIPHDHTLDMATEPPPRLLKPDSFG